MRTVTTLLSERVACDPALCGLLAELARKYVWWKTADLALRHPELIVSKVMDLGDYDDVQRVVKRLGDDCLRHVLQSAEIGQFSEASWAYWHYRLGQPSSAPVPPMPRRQLG